MYEMFLERVFRYLCLVTFSGPFRIKGRLSATKRKLLRATQIMTRIIVSAP